MILKCLIIDDEPLAHNVILEYAKDIDYLEIVAQAYLPMKALEILNEQCFDLIFLDIQMPKLSGLDMLRLSKQKPEVIITSAYESYALKSYEFDVCDYLLKPFRFERFLQAVEKVKAKLNTKSTGEKVDKYIVIKSDKRYIQVLKEDIQHLESYGNYVKVWSLNGCILTASTLTAFHELLDESLFLKIHKSFVVNKDWIDYIEGNIVVMKDEKQLPISKNYKKKFVLALQGA